MTIIQNHKLIILRKYQRIILFHKPMKVFSNNKPVGELYKGQIITLEIEEGQYTIRVEYGRRSKCCDVFLRHDVNLLVSWNCITGGIDLFET